MGVGNLFWAIAKTGQIPISEGFQSVLATIALNGPKGLNMARGLSDVLAAVGINGPDANIVKGFEGVLSTIGQTGHQADSISAGFTGKRINWEHKWENFNPTNLKRSSNLCLISTVNCLKVPEI